MKSDVVKSSKRGLKLIDVKRSINYTFVAYFFNRSMQGGDSSPFDPATSIQEQKFAAYRTILHDSLLTVSNATFQICFLKRYLVCLTLFLYVGHFQP